MVTIQKYIRAQSLEEAYMLNQSRQNRIIGGMLWLKMSNLRIQTAIDLCDLGLDAIEETEDAFRIGAMATLRQLEQHDGLNRYTQGAAAEAVGSIVGVQFRNLATVGGSLWGRFGFSDVLTLFLALDSYVELYKGGIVPLAEFAAMKPDRDILVRLIVKKTPGCFSYRSMRIQRTDFPVITCAASQMSGRVRITVGARPHKAMVAAEEAINISPEGAKALADKAAAAATTGSNLRGSAAYRTHLIRVLAERCILALGGKA